MRKITAKICYVSIMNTFFKCIGLGVDGKIFYKLLYFDIGEFTSVKNS